MAINMANICIMDTTDKKICPGNRCISKKKSSFFREVSTEIIQDKKEGFVEVGPTGLRGCFYC